MKNLKFCNSNELVIFERIESVLMANKFIKNLHKFINLKKQKKTEQKNWLLIFESLLAESPAIRKNRIFLSADNSGTSFILEFLRRKMFKIFSKLLF